MSEYLCFGECGVVWCRLEVENEDEELEIGK